MSTAVFTSMRQQSVLTVLSVLQSQRIVVGRTENDYSDSDMVSKPDINKQIRKRCLDDY